MARSETALLEGATPTPLYHRLFVILRDKILGGELAAGALLPSEHELAEHYGVSRITVKRALDDLAAERLVKRRRGRGTTVTHDYRPAPVRAPLAGLIDTIEVMGRRSTVRLIEAGAAPVAPAVAAALGVAPGTEAFHALRVRSVEGTPFALLRSHTLWPAAAALAGADLADTPRLTLFGRTGHAIARATQSLSASLADDRLAGLLAVAVGSPLLLLSRTSFDAADRPFDHLTSLYVPGRFEYRMDLDPRATGAVPETANGRPHAAEQAPVPPTLTTTLTTTPTLPAVSDEDRRTGGRTP